MKQVYIALLVLLALFFQSCQDNFSVQIPESRSYQQDAEILNRFVDINKTTHEYYINPNKRSSVLSYITNADVEELNTVNQDNLDLFERNIGRVNGLAGQLALNHGVDYIVMITNNDTYISQINNDSPIELKRNYANTRSHHSKNISLRVTEYKEQCSVYENSNIETSIELYPHSYQNAGWSFLVTCEMKENGDKDMITVLFCGVGYSVNPSFVWHADRSDAEWNFEVVSSSNPDMAKLNFSYQ